MTELVLPTARAQESPMAPATAEATIARGWIQSPAFDLTLFVLSPIVGLVIVFAALAHPMGTMLGVAAAFALGVPHYVSTLTFYLGDENRTHYFSRPLAFIAAPVVIFALVLALRVVDLHSPVIIVIFVWNIWHVSLQSAGILAIYRNLNGGPDTEKTLAKTALFTLGATMAFWNPATFPPLHDFIEGIRSGAYRAVTLTLLTIATASVLTFGWKILRRKRRISAAEGAFLITSLLLFHPYLWVVDGELATLAMLSGHFIQYLAIVWLLNARRYAAAEGSRPQRMLGGIGRNPALVIGFMLVVGVSAWLASRGAAYLGVPMAFVIALNSLALIHFHLDGQIWAFRHPFVRRTIGPFLMPESRRAPNE